MFFRPLYFSFAARRRGRQSGFTAIELLVTISVLGILLALAIPSFVDFSRASRGSTVSSLFVAGMTRARTEAISQNVCVKICQSANINTVSDGSAATCATSLDDWQRGWIIFRVPDCDTTLTNPANTDVLAARVGEYPDFKLSTTSGTVRRFFIFDPRGVMLNGVAPNLTLTYVPDGISSKHSRSVCVSIAGRVTVRRYGGTTGCTG